MFSNKELYYKGHTSASILFGYLFEEIDELIEFENSLMSSIMSYIKETKKQVDTKTFLGEEGGYIFEITIAINGKK